MQYNEDYFNSEEFKELLENYEAAMQVGEQPFLDADDLVDLADYYNFTGEGDKAVEAIDHALELYPEATLPNVFKARQALTEGDFETARRYADTIGDKDDPDYHYLTVEIMVAEGHIEKADLYLRRYAKSVDEDEWEDFVKDCANLYVDYGINDKAYQWMMRSRATTAPTSRSSWRAHSSDWANIKTQSDSSTSSSTATPTLHTIGMHWLPHS